VSVLRRVELHPDALLEAHAAREWYGSHDPRAEREFSEELDRAFDRIAEDPRTWLRDAAGTRRYLLRRFPFFVIYREIGGGILILAVAHARRRPGYWRAR
jgi:plasmid stabilization system protein ParE